MIAYKLCRRKKNGEITPLFINKTKALPFNKWMRAECHPTKGFAVRPFWHCTSETLAPHLSKKGRVWVRLEMKGFTEIQRPKKQGGLWYLAKQIRLLEIIEE